MRDEKFHVLSRALIDEMNATIDRDRQNVKENSPGPLSENFDESVYGPLRTNITAAVSALQLVEETVLDEVVERIVKEHEDVHNATPVAN